MRILTSICLTLLFFCIACSPSGTETKETATTAAPASKSAKVQLKKLWSSADGFVTPEAIIYDEARNVFYVANINENPWSEDKNGFISKMDGEGKIIDLKWVTGGLSAPKGMAIDGDFLIVADIDDLVVIHIPTGSINGRSKVGPKANLNDITMDAAGNAYVSASNAKAIYRKLGNDFKPMISNLKFSPNGVLYHDGQLYVLGFDSNKMYKVNTADNSLTEYASDLGAADGIESDGQGGFIVSSWTGAIFHVNSKGESTKLLDTSADKKGAADIEYIAKTQTLYVPTFFDNHIDAYQLILN